MKEGMREENRSEEEKQGRREKGKEIGEGNE